MLTMRHYARPYRAKCDCCKRVTAVQDKAEVTNNGLLIGEVTICMQCLPAFAGEQPLQPAAAPSPSMPKQSPSYQADDVIDEEPTLQELSDADYDALLDGADEVVGLFG